MSTIQATKKIAQHLKMLMISKELKLEYVAASAQVGIETVRRIKTEQVQRLLEPTALKIADFIEKESEGKISMDFLLGDLSIQRPQHLQNLQGATIKDENWTSKNLQGFNLTQTKFINVNLDYANFQGANLQGATLINSRLMHTHLINANLSEIWAEKCTFQHADMRCSIWHHATLFNCDFHNADHTSTDMQGTIFKNVSWLTRRYRGGMLLRGADLEGIKGIALSPAINKQIILNLEAPGKEKIRNLFARMIDGSIMDWQQLLYMLNNNLLEINSNELLDALTQEPAWLNQLRLSLEQAKREMYLKEFRSEWPDWPKESQATFSGHEIRFADCKGFLDENGHVDPVTLQGPKDEFKKAWEKWGPSSCRLSFNEILHLCLNT